MVTRQELEDERAFLLRSLEDLDREHDAGDLSDEDHAVLRDGYIARTAQVLKALDGGAPSVGGTPAAGGRRHGRSPKGAVSASARSRRRGRWIVVAVVAVIGGAVWAVVAHVGPRLPGESVTGSVTLTSSQQTARTLAQAETLESQGDAVDAVKLYGTVLRRDPNQEQALAEAGWLEYEAGADAKKSTLLSLGEGDEQRAEQVDPGDFAPHLYLGSMLLAQGDSTGAVDQYRDFLADHPPRAKVTAAVPFIVQAFSDAHLTPPSLPVGH
jgi:tetratricopeptide (TPR) repeat protein